MRGPTRLHPQLSFNVEQHPHARRDDDPAGYLVGSLKISGELNVAEDLQPGDELTANIATADGVVVAQAVLEVGAIAFKPIKADGSVIGTDRVHTAKVRP